LAGALLSSPAALLTLNASARRIRAHGWCCGTGSLQDRPNRTVEPIGKRPADIGGNKTHTRPRRLRTPNVVDRGTQSTILFRPRVHFAADRVRRERLL